MPYINLRSEMEKRGVTISDISRGLNMRRATISDKIHGKFRFYYDEVQKIKKEFFPDCEIEYLFSVETKEEADVVGDATDDSSCH